MKKQNTLVESISNDIIDYINNKDTNFKNVISNIVYKHINNETIPFHYTDIKTFEDACDRLDINPNQQLESLKCFGELSEYMVANYKLTIIIKAINNGWSPDWTSNNQKKWNPYFEDQGRSESCSDSRSSGFSFRHALYDYSYVSTNCGSRLCFETREQAEYAGKQFVDLYEKYLMITK